MTNIPDILQSALARHRAGRHAEAGKLYRRVLIADSQNADALHLLGMLAFERRQYDQAAASIRRAIQSAGGRAVFHNNLGNVLQQQENYTGAIAAYCRAIEIDPDYAGALHNLGNAHRAAEDWAEAEACYRRAAELRDHWPDIHNNLGIVLRRQGRLKDAEASCRRAIEQAGETAASAAMAHNNLGLTLADQNRLDEAAACYTTAAALAPEGAEPHHNLGIVLERQCRHEEALAAYQRAIDCRADYAEAHFNRSLIWLMQGDLRRGWKEYEWRGREHGRPQCPGSATYRETSIASLAGKTVLIEAEQGLGDEIMFASCYGEIIDRAETCYLQCDPRLVDLFSRSFPSAQVVARATPTDASTDAPPKADLVLRAGSLPRLLRPTLDSFPRHRGYLVPDAERLEKWAARFDVLGDRFKVGISWRGGATPLAHSVKSTTLDAWAPLAALSDHVHWINLQYGDCREELREARDRHHLTIHDWPNADPTADLDDFAARVAALDLVISVSNTTVHVAGALAVPVWTLLADPPPWRWMLQREDSPWYPSMRLLRQSQPGAWSDVLARVAAALGRRCQSLDTKSIRIDRMNHSSAPPFFVAAPSTPVSFPADLSSPNQTS
ncbi:MAG: glycosyltransferase family protein [Planctomycetes bacterium]|nr:glycosyltransferase family protein [Planctomycetota bacterium]